MMKKALSLTVIIFLLAGCGEKAPTPKIEVKYMVPADCQSTKILESLPASIPDARWIDTKWKPAAGTDLFNAINSGGIACSYGNQQKEIGATIIWAPSDSKNFEAMAAAWNMSKVDIPGVSEESAYWLGNDATGADDIHRWSINLLYKSNWIQVNGSFIYSMDDALPIINAAIGSLNRG